MKITLSNGMTLEGTPEQIAEVAKRLGYPISKDFYESESKGVILISEMATTHLKNALLKMYSEWVDSLRTERVPKELFNKIMNGINDPTFIALLREYQKRE